MLQAFLRRIFLYLSVLCTLGFGLVFLHALIEPSAFSRPAAGLGIGLALLATLLAGLSLGKSDDYLTPLHARIFLAGTAVLTGIAGLSLLSYFYFSGRYPTSYVFFFGVAPALIAIVVAFVAFIRFQEAYSLPAEYRETPVGGIWGGYAPIVLALLAITTSGLLLFRTIDQVTFEPRIDLTERPREEPRVQRSEQEIAQTAQGFLASGRQFQEGNQYRRAFDAFSRAAALGSREAKFELAQIHAGHGFYRDLPKAVQYLDELARDGHIESLFLLGRAHRRSELGLPQNHQTAITYLRLAAERGHIEAQKQLGNMYNRGEGTTADPSLAYFWFRQAAEQGDPVAQNDIGILLINGVGVERDPVEGTKWLIQAAEQGVTVAEYNLGRSYYNGELVERDPSRAFYYFSRLAEKNVPFGFQMIGRQYLAGEGVEQDAEKAFEAFSRGARRGDVLSEFYVGYLFLNGIGTPRDTTAALSFLESAARRRQPDAQLLLGRVFLEGEILMADAVEAVKWLTLAAEAGQEEAGALLERAMASLSPSEILLAQEQASAFLQTQAR